MTDARSARPPRRWYHAVTTLDDFAVVTFRVETERLCRQVPQPFAPTSFAFADGTEGSLVSVVAFVERDFRFRFAPFARVSGSLVDYRAYGRVGDEQGVFVFRTSLDHPFVVIPRLLWRMPWAREAVRIDGRWDGPGPDRVQVATDGPAGLSMDLTGSGREVGVLDGFSDATESVRVLTHPMAGWYGSATDLRRYSVWHEVLRPQAASVGHAEVPFFRELDLLERDGATHSAMVVRTATFDVHTPPRRVR